MKRLGKVGIIGLVLIIGLAVMGCNTLTASNEGAIGTISTPAAKDFTSLGLVFTEGQHTTGDGAIFTYYELLKKAQELGADTIVNVTIDQKVVGTKFLILDLGTITTWYGSALAIKYTDTLKETSTVVTEFGTFNGTNYVLGSGRGNGGGGVLPSAPGATAKPKNFFNLWGLLPW
jgi:hypothetical protein